MEVVVSSPPRALTKFQETAPSSKPPLRGKVIGVGVDDAVVDVV